MNLRHLEVLHAIMQCGSVTGAGELLGISQPAVTKSLKRAEDELGFKLFDRLKGRLVPTSEARTLYPSLRKLFDDLQSVDRTAVDIRHGRAGQLSLTSIPTLGEVIMPRAIAAFLKERPEVEISFQVRPRGQIVELVASQSVDLGFAFLAPRNATVETEVLRPGHLICIMPPAHPLTSLSMVTPQDVVGHKFIFYSQEQGLRALLESVFTEQRVEPRSTVEVGLISTAWTLVSAGVGVAIVDDLSDLKSLHPDVVSRPFHPQLAVDAEILSSRYMPRSSLSQEFLGVVRDVLSGAL